MEGGRILVNMHVHIDLGKGFKIAVRCMSVADENDYSE